MLPDNGSLHDLGAPFAGMLQYLETNLFGHVHYVPIRPASPDRQLHEYSSALPEVCVVAMGGRRIAGASEGRCRRPCAESPGPASRTVLAVLLSASVWAQPFDFLRVFADC